MKNILNIHDLQTRNQVRGLISVQAEKKPENGSSSNPTLARNHRINKIRLFCPANEIYDVTDYLIEVTQSQDEYLFNGFPKNTKDVLRYRRHKEIPLEKEISFQLARLNNSESEICDLIRKIASLNKLMLESDAEGSIREIESIIDTYGYSILLLRKIALLHASHKDDEAVSRFAVELISDPKFKAISTQYFQVHEIFEARSDYTHVLTKWSEKIDQFSNGKRDESRWWWDFYDSNLWPACYSPNQLSMRLLTYASFSLIDFLFLLQLHLYSSPFFKVFKEPFDIGSRLSNTIQQRWSEAFDVTMDPNVIIPSNPRGLFEGNGLYRYSLAYLEYPALASWRSAIDVCLRDRFSGSPLTAETLSSFISAQNYFDKNLKLKHLCSNIGSSPCLISRYSNKNSSVFYRSVAILYCIQDGQYLTDLNQNEVRLLLNSTTQLAKLLKIDELQALYDHSTEENQLVVAFLAVCMMYEVDPNDDRDFALRFALQKLVLDWFKGDLIELLNWLNNKTPELSKVVGQLCDVGFLEKLYFIIQSFDDVLKERARICFWIGETLNIQEYLDLSRRLTIDMKIREIRGTIDDTRIYIDEMRFNHWLEEHLKDDIHRITVNDIFSGAPKDLLSKAVVKNSQAEAFENGFGPDYWIVEVCQRAFSEFCTNKMFGITSYLGRRIRHGTLEGFLLSPVIKLCESHELTMPSNAKKFAHKKNIWLKEYRTSILLLKDEYLYFKDEKKTKGFFSSHILDSNERVMTYVAFHAALGKMLEGECDPSDVITQLSSYCWQTLQTDLLKIKKYIQQTLMPRVHKSINDQFGGDTTCPETRQFRLELDKLTATRLQDFQGWFEKPESVSVSATIREMFEAVLSEAREYHKTFTPTVEYAGETDSYIYGGTYHVIYDCLSVLMMNAAKYGKSDGELRAFCELGSEDGQGLVFFKFCSEFKDDSNLEEHKKKIQTAMEEKLPSAIMTIEGFSGIKKIRRIVSDDWLAKIGEGYSEGRTTYQIDGTKVTFAIMLPIILV